MKEAVILVHGIWMNGAELWRMRQFLSAAGYACHTFKYSSLRASPEENADRLNQFAQSINAPVTHFVCHSLGGLVVLHLFDKYFPRQRPGRIVFLGTPVNGSNVARRLYSTRFTRWILGRSVEHGLLGDRPVWLRNRELGIIAGTLPLGVGMVVGGLETPHDGTVSVEETYLGGATDFITLPVSHTGLLLSEAVAIQVVTFLRAGKFGDEAANLLFDPTS
jgi:hypothetical protein